MRRSVCTIVCVGLLSCAQTTTSSSAGAPSPATEQPSGHGAPGVDASTGVGARAKPDASLMSSCTSEARPGDGCDPLGDVGGCGVFHCGARSTLDCRDGHWELQPQSWQHESSPLDFVCGPEQAEARDFCTGQVQCCGRPVQQASECPVEGGCELCPPTEPRDGAACTLPTACDGQAAPRVIDCYYKCCCYGQATWAQCDGERWHLNTQCTPL
jgi:hypothetical protein